MYTQEGESTITLPGSQPPSPQSEEDGTDQLAKGCGIDRLQFVLGAVPQIVAVECGSRETDSFRRFVIVNQPCYLLPGQNEIESEIGAV